MNVKTAIIQERRSLEDWRRLGVKALQELHLEAEPDRWPPHVVREMAHGQRSYPRAIADKVREIYLRDSQKGAANA